jgi:hypothetical protein
LLFGPLSNGGEEASSRVAASSSETAFGSWVLKEGAGPSFELIE